ncbi:unnamed protein product [Caenorhabditis sp. 36 PRJEB53466]|nr:unnamed protein product [Caenorhabditis sp. 36 PRJEB53466]
MPSPAVIVAKNSPKQKLKPTDSVILIECNTPAEQYAAAHMNTKKELTAFLVFIAITIAGFFVLVKLT